MKFESTSSISIGRLLQATRLTTLGTDDLFIEKDANGGSISVVSKRYKSGGRKFVMGRLINRIWDKSVRK